MRWDAVGNTKTSFAQGLKCRPLHNVMRLLGVCGKTLWARWNFTGLHVWGKPGLSSYLVCLVHLVSLMQPDKPEQPAGSHASRFTAPGSDFFSILLGACPTLTFLLRRTIRDHLRRSRPEKILTVFQRIHLRFFQACGLASGRTSLASSRPAMLDRLLGLP